MNLLQVVGSQELILYLRDVLGLQGYLIDVNGAESFHPNLHTNEGIHHFISEYYILHGVQMLKDAIEVLK